MTTEAIRSFNDYYRISEKAVVQTLLDFIAYDEDFLAVTHQKTKQFVEVARASREKKGPVESLMVAFDLSTEEGVLLMCLAEALLRIPDTDTEDLLIRDKLTSARWKKELDVSASTLVTFMTQGLSLSSRVLATHENEGYVSELWHTLLRRAGEPVIRKAVRYAMKMLSEQFVTGRTIEEALTRSAPLREKGYTYSYDMLGEVARTALDAEKYYDAYYQAIGALGASGLTQDLMRGPSISVKLSALYPRYEYTHRDHAIGALLPKLKALLSHAKANQISLTIDAEETDRLDLSLDLIEALFLDPDFAGWEGLGLALQAYQKRAFYVLDWLIGLSKRANKRIQVRLVKGAYWDSEIKWSQVGGYADYPVFTRKINTDVSYIACAKKMLRAQAEIYPQFATHNAYTVSAILALMEDPAQYQFEFQNLQGMGKLLHNQLVGSGGLGFLSRIYAPVGSHRDLLPYLVRRLLENGANSSFVHHISDPTVPVEKLLESPLTKAAALVGPHSQIPLPSALYGEGRVNSSGLDFSDRAVRAHWEGLVAAASQKKWVATPLNRSFESGDPVCDPTDALRVVGHVTSATLADVATAFQRAEACFPTWKRESVEHRATILRRTADLMEFHRADLLYLLIREAGKTWFDAQAEVREAVDFCRYYAGIAETQLIDQVLPGPTGESNVLRMEGRGIMACVSPWNFPLAIFVGQLSAALVAGNVVLVKPSAPTPLIAAEAVRLFYAAGLPEAALQLLPGPGSTIGNALAKDPRTAGILFTGSTETAKSIYRTLADSTGPIPVLIAETGGLNVMIADSSSLPEQVVRDVMTSAFGSAGQRCSALRLLCVQEDIADNVITMLKGAMAELTVGDPWDFSTDIGPVINAKAARDLNAYGEQLTKAGRSLYQITLPECCQKGSFVAPQAYELSSVKELTHEEFGPILHVVRFKASELNQLVDEINALGYGLTFGLQSRITETVRHV
ncbi:MAG: bifunctional proline dehydrogenase/L-glutamate gamma-semialdehyde dehydrogenase, partial [Gammaproteobacteria bacterium RIFCSPHIGHO2_12_FULL_45_9]